MPFKINSLNLTGDKSLFVKIRDKEKEHSGCTDKYLFLLKHQAHSTDIFSTSWQAKEQQKKELEQQSFSFSTSWYSLQLAPSQPVFHSPFLCSLSDDLEKETMKEWNMSWLWKGSLKFQNMLVLNIFDNKINIWTNGEKRILVRSKSTKYFLYKIL